MTEQEHRCGLIGEHIAASLSPALFQWGLRQTGLTGSFALLDFPRRQARSFITGAPETWTGLNVTSPHKDLAYSLCDCLSDTAQAVKSVNTLSRWSGKLHGDNTDVAGFTYALNHLRGNSASIQRAMIIGTGGAARAVIHSLLTEFPGTELHIASRRPDLAGQRLDSLPAAGRPVKILTHHIAAEMLGECDLVVQATPIGSLAHPGYPLKPPLTFKPGALVMDLNYSPRKTFFLEAAEKFRARTGNGLVMLIAQAAASFRVWTGKSFPLEQAMKQLLPELQNS